MSTLFNRFKIFISHWIYRFRTWVVILILMRLFFFVIYQETGIGIRHMLDSDDYFSTAENVLSGNGFISDEHNPTNNRTYLGDNYYYASEPGYVIFLLFFFPNKLDHVLITMVSNGLLYILIMWLIWMSFALLGVKKIFYPIAMVLLLINPHIIHYSLRGVPELLRMTVILANFYCFLLVIHQGKTFRRSQIILLGILGGFSILTRMTFLLIPFLLIPLIIRYSNRKLLNTIIYISSIMIVLLPWVYRNYHDFGLITLDHRITHRHLASSDLPTGINLRKDELASGLWRITDNEKFVELRNENNAERRNKMLMEIEDTPLNWIKMYCLRGWELFKPFPEGGKLLERMQLTVLSALDPGISKILMQFYSLLIYLPWFAGFILFISGTMKDFKPLWIWFGLGFISFIGVHLLENSPHARYMLPLVPIGYISFFVFFTRNMKYKFAPIKDKI